MKKTYNNLKRQAQENPILAAGIAIGLFNATAKIIDVVSTAEARHAYAKDVDRRVKKSKNK